MYPEKFKCDSGNAGSIPATGIVHFVNWTNPEQYWNAVRIWGKPDFVHRYWDSRVKGGEYHPNDTLIFFTGTESDTPRDPAFNDSEHTQWVQNLLKGKKLNALA